MGLEGKNGFLSAGKSQEIPKNLRDILFFGLARNARSYCFPQRLYV